MVNLSPTELERYRRQIMLPGFGKEAQQRLKSATVLVTGVGGLGGTAALYLAVAGVGRLILVRGGELRLDDMNRQILMSDDWVGKPRVFKAKERLEDINPDVEVEAIFDYVTPDNVDFLVQSADVALDCAHNFTERDLLNAACVRWRKPMVEAAMDGMEAYLTTIVPGVTPCLSCLFPEKPEWDRRGFGVLGAVSGTLACLTALEAIKLITGCSQPLLSQLLTMDLHQMVFAKRRSYRDRNCPVCGTHSHHYPTSLQLSRALVNSQQSTVNHQQVYFMTLTLTEAAEFRLRTFLLASSKDENATQRGIRVGVEDGGCNGYQYSIKVINAPQADDIVMQQGKLSIYIDAQSAPLLEGVVVDFVDGLLESGFKFSNPNATDTCGCGKSFQAGNCSPAGVPCS